MFWNSFKDQQTRSNRFVKMFPLKDRLQRNNSKLWLSIRSIKICLNVKNELKGKLKNLINELIPKTFFLKKTIKKGIIYTTTLILFNLFKFKIYLLKNLLFYKIFYLFLYN